MGYLDSTLGLAQSMLANSASFRTMVGATDPTDALNYIVVGDAGAGFTKASFARLGIEGAADEEIGHGVFRRTGTIMIVLVRADSGAETAAARWATVYDWVDDVRTDLLALRGGSNALARFTANIEPGEHFDPVASHQASKSQITINLLYRG